MMEHPYFKDINFDEIEEYEQYESRVTEGEKYLEGLCQKLLGILEKEKEPSLEQRKCQFYEQIEPILSEELSKAK